MAKSTVETLAADIQKILDEYEGDVELLNQQTVKEIAKRGKQALKSNSGIWGGSGKYASGWSVKVGKQSRAFASAVLYNAKLPGLPHLLEFDHAKRGGGRTNYAKSHIEPVQNELEKIFEEELEKRL